MNIQANCLSPTRRWRRTIWRAGMMRVRVVIMAVIRIITAKVERIRIGIVIEVRVWIIIWFGIVGSL
jgi:hypothetical protein